LVNRHYLRQLTRWMLLPKTSTCRPLGSSKTQKSVSVCTSLRQEHVRRSAPVPWSGLFACRTTRPVISMPASITAIRAAHASIRGAHPLLPLRARSELSRPVDVRAMLDGYDGDLPKVVVDAVDHPVVAPASATEPLKAELQRLAGTVRILGQ